MLNDGYQLDLYSGNQSERENFSHRIVEKKIAVFSLSFSSTCAYEFMMVIVYNVGLKFDILSVHLFVHRKVLI